MKLLKQIKEISEQIRNMENDFRKYSSSDKEWYQKQIAIRDKYAELREIDKNLRDFIFNEILKAPTLNITNKMTFRELKQHGAFYDFKSEYGLTSREIRRSPVIRDMIETEIKYLKNKKEVNNDTKSKNNA